MTVSTNIPKWTPSAPPSAWTWTNPGLEQKYKSATTSSIPGVKVYLEPFSNAAKETGILNSLIKIARNVAKYFSILEASIPAKDFAANCGTFSDIVKVFSITKGIDAVLTNADKKNEKGVDLHIRNLSLASGIFETVQSGMAAFSLLDTFQIISLGQISQAIGTTAVLPFSAVVNGIDIAKNIIDITKSAVTIHQIKRKSKKLGKKLKAFNPQTDSQKIGTFLEKHIEQMIAKQLSTLSTMENLKAKAANRRIKAETAIEAYEQELLNSEENILHKLIKHIRLSRKETALFKAIKASDKTFENFTNTDKKFEARRIKLESWANAETHFKSDDLKKDANNKIDSTDPLHQLIADKQIKWRAERKNLKMDKLQEGLGIALSVVGTIVLIASTVLIFSGIGTLPVLLTITSVGLLISLIGLGKTLLKKYTVQEPVLPFNSTKYNFAATAA